MPLTIKRTNITSIAANSVLFNGSSQYLTATRTGGWLISANNFTLECWVYFTRNPTVSYGGIYHTCIAGTYQSNQGTGWELLLYGSSGADATTGIGFGAGSGNTLAVGITLNKNTWYHIALVKNSTTTSIYVNGVQSASAVLSSWSDRTLINIGRSGYSPYFYYFPGYISNFRIVNGTALYTSNFTPPSAPLTAVTNTSILTCNAATIVDSSTNNFTITNNGSATVSSINPFRAPINNFQFVNRNNIPTVSGTQKAIFGYGKNTFGTQYSITNIVSNTGVVASNTTGVGTERNGLAAAGYGGDKAIFGYGHDGAANVSMTNKVSNTGVVATDTTGVGQGRQHLAAASYGTDKAIFGYGYTNSNFGVSMTNRVSNIGVVATDTTGVGTPRFALAAAGYGTDKAIFGYGLVGTTEYQSITNKVSNVGVVATDTTGVGTGRYYLAASGYGTDKAIFGYGTTSTNVSMTNLVSNTGVVATDTTGIGTARYGLAAAGYGSDKAIFGYGWDGNNNLSMTNLVSNTGVVATDTTGIGTARYGLAAAGFSITTIPAPSGMSLKKVFADSATLITNGLVLNLDASNASSYPGSGTSWFDLSGNGNTGTLVNGVGYNSANGGSLVFDGVDDYATVSNNITPGTGDFAVSVWVYKTETASNRYIWDFGSNGGTLSSGTSVTPGFRYYNPTIGIGGSLYTSGPIHSINTWYNIVISRISGTTYFYSNGSLITSGADAGNIGSFGTTLNIGRYGGGGLEHQGRLSSLLVYKNKGLTLQEIQQNYNATKAKFGL